MQLRRIIPKARYFARVAPHVIEGRTLNKHIKVLLPKNLRKIGVLKRVAGEISFTASQKTMHIAKPEPSKCLLSPSRFSRKEWRILNQQTSDKLRSPGGNDGRQQTSRRVTGDQDWRLDDMLDKPHEINRILDRRIICRIFTRSTMAITVDRKHVIALR